MAAAGRVPPVGGWIVSPCSLPQHCLYFLPLPHGQGSFRPGFAIVFAGKIKLISAIIYCNRAKPEKWAVSDRTSGVAPEFEQIEKGLEQRGILPGKSFNSLLERLPALWIGGQR